MTKKEFAKLLFEKGVFTTRTEAEKKVDIIFDSIEKILLDGENLSIINWGKLEIVERAPRLGRNPKTGEEDIKDDYILSEERIGWLYNKLKKLY